MNTLKEVFEALVNKMQQFDLYTMNPHDEVALVLDELKDKIDEVEKRMLCVSKTQKDIYNTIREYTSSVDGGGDKKHITLQHHDVIQSGCYDIEYALNMSDDTCIVDNWHNLFEPKKEVSDYEHLIGKTYIVGDTIHDGIKGCITKISEVDINVDNEVIVKTDIQDPSVIDLACLMWLNIDEVSEYEEPLPMCVKINGKIFFYGSERYEVVVNDNDLNMIELFDITTEMETGDSYQIFVSDISYFEVASDEERQAVADFFIKSQLELFPN